MMYGMGVNKLSDQLGIEVDEAKSLITQYHDRVPVSLKDYERRDAASKQQAQRRCYQFYIGP